MQTDKFEDVNAYALAAGLVFNWFPRARRTGGSIRIGNLAGDPGSSLSICSRTGKWLDHSTGEGGGDLVSLYAAINRLSQGEALRQISGKVPCSVHDTHIRRYRAEKRKRDAQEKERYARTRHRAVEILVNAPDAPDDHPYLVNKHVRNHGLRLYGGTLVVPMYGGGGEITGLQFIDRDGEKRFLTGSRKKGSFYLIGKPEKRLLIAEGYSTGATLYEQTGYACAVAFDCGNLEPVAKTLRAKYPDMNITVCADNDTQTEGNPGVSKARAAAVSIGASLAVPPLPGDFNDFYKGQ